MTWRQYLDEIARAGYMWTELGPQGFLPRDPAQLRDELDTRGLRVCGGTVFAGLHRGKEALDKAIEHFSREARLLTAVGTTYLIQLPEQYTDMHTGAATESADIDPEHWTNLVSGTNQLGRVMLEEFGVNLVFHPHVDTHVDTQERIERFLTDTDPRFVNLCLDTGHIAYCDGDNVDIVRKFPSRITYVHIKQVDPEVREHVRAEQIPLAGEGTATGVRQSGKQAQVKIVGFDACPNQVKDLQAGNSSGSGSPRACSDRTIRRRRRRHRPRRRPSHPQSPNRLHHHHQGQRRRRRRQRRLQVQLLTSLCCTDRRCVGPDP